jgi:hypothetical protein
LLVPDTAQRLDGILPDLRAGFALKQSQQRLDGGESLQFAERRSGQSPHVAIGVIQRRDEFGDAFGRD